MTDIQTLFDQLPVGKIAEQAGVSEPQASEAIKAVLPALVSGMEANAQDPAGAASLGKALGAHQHAFSKRVQGEDIDVKDGEKIVQHVFGQNESQVINTLSSASGGGDLKEIIRKILPIVAPIVIAWLANKYLGGDASDSTKKPAPKQDSGFGDLGEVLGGLLGSSSGSSSNGGIDLGGLLGGLLGGGRK